MSWYVGQDGQQIWIQRDEMVYTVVQSSETLPAENLAYLAVQSKKPVFHEAICEEDLYAEGKSSVPRRRRARQGGRQRGFILRADTEEPLTRVVPWFKASAQKLIDCDVVSRIDADEAANMKKKKKNDRMMTLLGVNECRIETTARINHFAHGPGFRVEVAEGTAVQKIHFFTNRKELPEKDWIAFLTAAVQSTGVHVMMARRARHTAEAADKQGEGAEGNGAAEGGLKVQIQIKKDKAQQDDDAWFESMMNGCMIVNSDREEEASSGEEGELRPERDSLAGDAAAGLRPVAAQQLLPDSLAGDAAAGLRPVATQQLLLSQELSGREQQQQPRPQPPKDPAHSSLADHADAPRLRPEPPRHESLQWRPRPREPTLLQEEVKPRTVVHARDQARKCAECGRGRPLKLFVDDDDGLLYCRMCWVEYYGLEPPTKC